MKKIIVYGMSCVFVYSFCFSHIVQVIVPMAGLGTRLLPLTKAVSKSMVPLVDKPALQHVVEEALQSNIYDLCFIINENERHAIEHYFSKDLVLDAILRERKKCILLHRLMFLFVNI